MPALALPCCWTAEEDILGSMTCFTTCFTPQQHCTAVPAFVLPCFLTAEAECGPVLLSALTQSCGSGKGSAGQHADHLDAAALRQRLCERLLHPEPFQAVCA